MSAGVPRRKWTDEFGDRAFWFDAFVSHNRTDTADALIGRLSARGARVTSDHDGPAPGWTTTTSLFSKMLASRYIVVRVGQQFRFSPWIKAEVVASTSWERRTGLERLLVVHEAGADVPPELQRMPAFEETDAGVAELTAHVTYGNRLPGGVLDARRALRSAVDGGSLDRVARSLRSKIDVSAGDWWHAAAMMLVGESGSPRIRLAGNEPLVIVSAIEERPSALPPSLADELVVLMRSLISGSRLTDDERSWLLRLLLCAASQDAAYWDDVLDCLAAEPEGAVAYDMLTRIRRAGGPGGSDPRIAMAALVSGDVGGLFADDREHICAGLPTVILAHVTSREAQIDLGQLSVAERVNLTSENLPEALANAVTLELSLIDLGDLVDEHPRLDPLLAHPRDNSTATIAVCASMLTWIDWAIAYSLRADGRPLIGVYQGERAFVRPIVMSLQIPELRDYGRGVAERTVAFFREMRADHEGEPGFFDYSSVVEAAVADHLC